MKEFETDYIKMSDYLINLYYKNKKYGEALQEINALKQFMKQKGLGESSFYFAKASLITALIILANPSDNKKQQGINACEQV
mmetsp:Transcript_29996/g.29230  ORF Transcript_29996/g.29230 Transcript_29996/m.29230 type:complete len:82 (-) Transcript_29996:705-950(-)|eukprot:CAMPEP_0170566130 /NCGR_PEP_ID=MMETSP0211-20121228/79640_1 /TAXON_ID=311385 /ORGANISM="Pseudokeronopsis sp., Strain OXSARD2" /LENGTH=81 /DNA_ID=CAMNT_0010887215 /DNA_START=1512 /DNA_END=1757 /DNA_ORIENTATION=-